MLCKHKDNITHNVSMRIILHIITHNCRLNTFKLYYEKILKLTYIVLISF